MFKSQLCVLCCSLNSVSADGRGLKWHESGLFPREGSLFLPLFMKPSQKSQQSALFCPRLLLDLCLHPICVSCLPAQCSCVLPQVYGWVSKLQILVWHGSVLSSGGGSCCTLVGTGLFQKGSHTIVQRFGFYGKVSQEVGIQVSCPQQASLLIC